MTFVLSAIIGLLLSGIATAIIAAQERPGGLPT